MPSGGPFTPSAEDFDLQPVVAERIEHHGLPMAAGWRLNGLIVIFFGDCTLVNGETSPWSVHYTIKSTRTREHVRKHVEAALLRLHTFLEESQADGTTFKDAMTPEQRYLARTAPAEIEP